jgi:hypothetical protein
MTYNGWENYPTWATYTWLSSDYYVVTLINDQVSEIVKDLTVNYCPDELSGLQEDLIYELSKCLPDFIDELFPGPSTGLQSDILEWGKSQINWRSLSEAFVEGYLEGMS